MELRKNPLDQNRHAPRGLEGLGDAMATSKEKAGAARARRAEARGHASSEASATPRGVHGDRVELSPTARLFAGDGPESDEARASLVESLTAAYQDGTLNTRERIERAASRLLGGE